jgi:hypothetical protein
LAFHISSQSKENMKQVQLLSFQPWINCTDV